MIWMFLLPGSITSLRHEWTHPLLEESGPADNPKAKRLATAERRLKELADDAGISYNRLLEGMEDHANSGDWIHLGTDTPNVYDEVWDDYELVTGNSRKDGESHFFSCSC